MGHDNESTHTDIAKGTQSVPGSTLGGNAEACQHGGDLPWTGKGWTCGLCGEAIYDLSRTAHGVKVESSELIPENAEKHGKTLHSTVNSDFIYIMDRIKALESRLTALEAQKVPEFPGKHFSDLVGMPGQVPK